MNLKLCRVYVDAACRGNPGPSSVGVLVCDERDTVRDERSKTIGKYTNNQAEYMAAFHGLRLASRYSKETIEVYSDSQLVVNQLNGEWKVKDEFLMDMRRDVIDMEKKFRHVKYIYVPRDSKLIRRADAMANQALDEQRRQ